MNTPDLIQRGKIEDRDHKNGIDSIINLDYMGSSEFEWGAVPDSLDRIRENIGDYVKITYAFQKSEDKILTVFCKKEVVEEIGEILEGLAENKYTLQEYSDLNNFAYPDGMCKCYVQFWWDIVNDWMCWIQDEEFELKFDKKIV